MVSLVMQTGGATLAKLLLCCAPFLTELMKRSTRHSAISFELYKLIKEAVERHWSMLSVPIVDHLLPSW